MAGPSAQDDISGVPYSGSEGSHLRKVLDALGYDLEDFWYSYATVCHSKSGITDLHIESCRPSVSNAISDKKPTVIIPMGQPVVKSLLFPEWGAVGPMSEWVGWAVPSPLYGAWVCPTFDPAYILAVKDNEVLLRMFKEHIRDAIKKAQEPKVPYFDQKALLAGAELITDPRLARLRLRDLAGREGVLAFDYETTGVKPEHPGRKIFSVSFCLDDSETFACVLDEKCHKALSSILQNPKLLKVASNMKFEERWTIQKLGHSVESWYHDTMIMAHVLDNRRGICSIKFQAYIHLGLPGYDEHIHPYFKGAGASGQNRIEELGRKDLNDLLTYNAVDSVVEFKIMLRQRKELGL